MRQMKPTIKQQKRYNIFNECVNVLLFWYALKSLTRSLTKTEVISKSNQDQSLKKAIKLNLAKKFIKEYLREKLHYDNLVITDDIRMKPVDLLYKSVSLKKAFTSGADIILFKYRKDDYKVINKVIKMVKTGKIKEEDIDKSVTRILRIKEKYNISDKKKINGCNIEELNKQIEELNSILN